MRFKNRSEAALHVWDYFYVTRVPVPGDEKPWGMIERATCRIRETDAYLDTPWPPDVRLKNARRFRNSVRIAQRYIQRLSETPETWIIDALARMATLADELIRALRESSGQLVVY